MAAGDLCTIADVEAWGGPAMGAPGADSVIGRLITSASDFICNYCSLDFQPTTSYTEIRSGSGGQDLFLANVPPAGARDPVTVTIQSLQIDTTIIPPQAAFQQPGYFLTAGGYLLSLYGYCYTKCHKNVLVTYQAGFNSVPFAISQACIELVVSRYRLANHLDLVGKENQAGEKLTWAQLALAPSIMMTLKQYSQVVPL